MFVNLFCTILNGLTIFSKLKILLEHCEYLGLKIMPLFEVLFFQNKVYTKTVFNVTFHNLVFLQLAA
jgi:hypothetical protein